MSQNIPDDNTIGAMLNEAAQAYPPPAGTKQAVKAALMTKLASPKRVWFRLPKIAAAAAVIAVAILGAWWFQGSPDMASYAFAGLLEAVDNTKSAEWVHVRAVVAGEEIEQWISFQPFRHLHKSSERVMYKDGRTHRSYLYDPSTRTITIEYVVTESMEQKQSFLDFMLAAVDTFKGKENTEVLKKKETINGKVYTVYTLNFTGQEVMGSMEWRVDPKAKRVVNLRAQGGQLPEPVVIHFDYPDSGPADIYALGVPRDAKIIDQTPSEELLDLDNNIRAARDAFAPSYYAIICTASIKEQTGVYQPIGVHVVYKKSGKYRIEQYSALAKSDVPITDMKAMRAWIEQTNPGAVKFIVGPNEAVDVRLNKEGDMVKDSNQYTSGQDNVESVSWGQYISPNSFSLVSSENKQASRLIGVEHSWQGHVYNQKVASYPGRSRQYFNPDRDYMRDREKILHDAQADWQQDKDWLKDVAPEPAAMSYESSNVTEVVEYAKTVQGQWYAKKIIFKQSGVYKGSTVRIVHLDTTREIPDELLDPANIKRDAFVSKEKLFAWHFGRAIKTLDARKDWPNTPEEVSRVYWEARATKNYSEMAVLWPGSDVWNHELKDEKPVKYVFGKAYENPQAPEYTHVPYAAEAYYREHGRYNIKMILTNKDSAKGRYYIVSGN